MIIDIDKLIHELSEDVAYTMLNKFIVTHKEYEDFLNLAGEDLDRYIHKLKGSSGNLKMISLYELCVSYYENQNKNEIVSKIKKEMPLTFDKINEILKNQKSNNKTVDIIELNSLLDKLILDLDEYTYIEDSRFKLITNSLKGTVSDKMIENLEKNFIKGDYDSLKNITETIRNLV
ncbi:MAG: Hpt domain-containing protein [Sulfurovum sp.]|jgi:hypothetical protein